MTQKRLIEMADALDYNKIITMARHYEREFRILENDENKLSEEFTCDVIKENSFEKYDQPFVYRSIKRYLKNKNLSELDLMLISYQFLKKHVVSYAE